MPASRRQLALKDMKDAEGASLIGKISSRFTGESMAVSTNRPFLLVQDEPFFSFRTNWGRSPRCHPRRVRVIYTLA
jgi:hypothetical protein